MVQFKILSLSPRDSALNELVAPCQHMVHWVAESTLSFMAESIDNFSFASLFCRGNKLFVLFCFGCD